MNTLPLLHEFNFVVKLNISELETLVRSCIFFRIGYYIGRMNSDEVCSKLRCLADDGEINEMERRVAWELVQHDGFQIIGWPHECGGEVLLQRVVTRSVGEFFAFGMNWTAKHVTKKTLTLKELIRLYPALSK